MIIPHYEKLSDTLFQKFSSLVQSKTGIYLKPEKKELLNTRLTKRLRARGMMSFKEYYECLVNDRSGEELVHFIDCVSTNFTSFFREEAHFDYLTSTVLPAFAADATRKRRELIFWSSACSSGEEPYTLAIVIEEYLRHHPGLRYRIIATDISTRVLSQAVQGVYPVDRVDKVPTLLLKKYFRKGVRRSEGNVKVKDAVRRMIQFERFNLMDEFPWQKPLDVIFCRNVMIYFNRETQQALIDKFYKILAPGGYLFIGHSESLTSIQHQFRQMAATCYRK